MGDIGPQRHCWHMGDKVWPWLGSRGRFPSFFFKDLGDSGSPGDGGFGDTGSFFLDGVIRTLTDSKHAVHVSTRRPHQHAVSS